VATVAADADRTLTFEYGACLTLANDTEGVLLINAKVAEVSGAQSVKPTCSGGKLVATYYSDNACTTIQPGAAMDTGISTFINGIFASKGQDFTTCTSKLRASLTGGLTSGQCLKDVFVLNTDRPALIALYNDQGHDDETAAQAADHVMAMHAERNLMSYKYTFTGCAPAPAASSATHATVYIASAMIVAFWCF
jgi:hypothetical protein